MVESSTAKAAEMALKLDAQHRWAVTGTPLSRGLEDLFGLLVRSSNHCFTDPVEPSTVTRDPTHSHCMSRHDSGQDQHA